jgi:hypothetical protein
VALPSTNKTPQKLAALREPPLQHAHSSGNLRRPAKPRRKSTNWAGASPSFRQKALEDVIDTRMADVFFTLHCEGQQDPIYISEIVDKAMNPTFRFFDLSAFGPGTTRLDTVVVKIWIKRGEWTLLIEETVNLQSLQFIGSLENHPFPPNCILFHLVDGIYTIDLTSKPPKPKPGASLPTSSYSALMRLSNLDESIQDALATREELAAQINAILHSGSVDESPQAQEEVLLANRYVLSEKKMLKASVRRRAELKASIEARRKAIESGRTLQAKAQDDIDNAQDKLANCKTLLSKTTLDLHGQRRRICEELTNIFPIEPTDQTLLFKVCNLRLPNSLFDDVDEDLVSAALGHVARLVDMLQYYLSVPLPYPITAYGSRSIIQDFISVLQDNQRTFPLYLKSAIRFRFDYGVFLLNKNIECLAESQGLKVMDIRQTLPNLKYLLYICSAGTSELPSRKSGGIRGLLTGRGMGIESRRGSADSGIGVAQSEAARMALETGTIEPKSRMAAGIGLNLPFRADQIHSLRTSGLRENVMR